MKYDFETVVNRANAGSSKWERMKALNPEVPSYVIPLSVADMEFKNPPEITEGLKSFLNDAILGYTQADEEYFDILKNWFQKKYSWKIEKEWVCNTPGVVNAMFQLVKALTQKNDGVIILSPVYYPFYLAIKNNERKLVDSKLLLHDGHYTVDFEDLEQKVKDLNNKILILCNPHNPIGRVWTREELVKIGNLCLQNNVTVISDEIHCDLIMPGFQHTNFASISKQFENNCIVCSSPSKTFNLAGLQTSNIIISNADIMQKFKKELGKTAQLGHVNPFAYEATKIAYTKCDEWLAQLISKIDDNRRHVEIYFKENLPQVKTIPLEGTYLMWLDCRDLGIPYKELERINTNEAFFFVDEGYIFGSAGEQFERINLACPTKVLMEAMERFTKKMKMKKGE